LGVKKMGESARDSLCRHGSKRNSPNRYVLPMGAGPLTGDMCEPTTSRFSFVALRNICNLQLSAFQGLRAFQFFFIVFSEFLKDFPIAFRRKCTPMHGRDSPIDCQKGTQRKSAPRAYESTFEPRRTNLRVCGAFAASRLNLNKGQVSPRVHIIAKLLQSSWTEAATRATQAYSAW
jgi:hypothetical protein